MSDARIDLSALPVQPVESGELWISHAPYVSQGPSPRLLEAFARGEVTEGGMAEAGWRYVGQIGEGGIVSTPGEE